MDCEVDIEEIKELIIKLEEAIKELSEGTNDGNPE